jgi:protein-tyrosine-phosphatase
LQQASRVIAYHRRRVAKSFLNPIADMALMFAIAQGKIPYVDGWRGRRWLFTADVSIDAGRDSAAKVAERNAGLRSSASVFDENGEDAHEQEEIIAREVRNKIDTAKKIAAETGVSVDFVLTMLGTNTPNGFLFSTPETTPPGRPQVPEPQDGQDQPQDGQDPEDDVAAMGRVRGILHSYWARQATLRQSLANRKNGVRT